jgi:hypothetical protein
MHCTCINIKNKVLLFDIIIGHGVLFTDLLPTNVIFLENVTQFPMSSRPARTSSCNQLLPIGTGTVLFLMKTTPAQEIIRGYWSGGEAARARIYSSIFQCRTSDHDTALRLTRKTAEVPINLTKQMIL